MKKQLFTLSLVTLLALPGALLAAEHNMSGMDHNMAGMDHGAIAQTGDMHKGMLTVGEQTVDGVKAVVSLNDVKVTMAKMGMKETHHLMIRFINSKDGKVINSGSAAVKIKGPNGIENPAIKMMGMEGHFGVDVVLDQNGPYIFTVGTQLADGAKRQFELKYNLK